MRRLWFLLTHKFRVEKYGSWWRVAVKKKGKWYFLIERFPTRQGAERYRDDVKKRGFV